tara:strand:+ start:7810 stop:8277 length:468 start_codon:yes stop_codon:yes gene_type:complete
MAQLKKNFRVEDAPISTAYDSLPPGDYVCIVTESEMKPTKKPGGEYLMLSLEVVEGKYKNRRLWSRLNIVNANSAAVEIAERQLADLCRAVGRTEISDSNELHDVPFTAVVKVRPADGAYDESNDVVAYKSAKTASGVPATSASPPWSSGKSEPF